jgi:hypothetical protein
MNLGSKDLQLICFANEAYYENQRRLIDSATRFEVKVSHVWTQAKLRETEFYSANRAILDQARGAGYWLWKPYIVLQALLESPPNSPSPLHGFRHRAATRS